MQNPAQMLSKLFQKKGKKKSSKGVQPAPDTSGSVYIRVRMADLQTDPDSPPTGQQMSGHLYLIEGTFEDISRYAGVTVNWVIKIARLLCEPLGNGCLYTHTTGTPDNWRSSDRDYSWREVAWDDLLHPGIYEFTSTRPITLSKISDRQTRSVTTQGTASRSNANAFRRILDQRDGVCVVTRCHRPLVASHLIPRRIGTDGAKAIVERFASVSEATDIHDFHPKIGILLVTGLDNWVDRYEAGFYHVTVSPPTHLFIVLLNIAWRRTILIYSTISALTNLTNLT